MSAKIIHTLVTELTADGAKFKKEMDKTLQQSKTWGDSVGNIAKNVGVGLLAAGATAATGLAVLTKSSIDNADALFEQGQKLAISVENLSAYHYASSMSGLETEKFNGYLNKLNATMASAYDGVGKGADAFKMLGVELVDSQGNMRSNSAVLLDLADAFSRLPDSVEKSALAQDIFGKSGSAMIPFLNNGRDGIKSLTDEAERLGLVVDQKTAEAANRFNDELDKLALGAKGVGYALASEALPYLNKLASFLNDPETQEGARSLASGLFDLAEKGYLIAKMVPGIVQSAAALEELFEWMNKTDPSELAKKEEELNALVGRARIAYGEEFWRDHAYQRDTIASDIDKLKAEIEQIRNSASADLSAELDAQGWEGAFDMPAEPSAPAQVKTESPLKKKKEDEWRAQQELEISELLKSEKRQQEAADREVEIQRDKFARIHEETLMAQGLDVELEELRYQKDQEELNADLENLRAHGLLTAELEAEFQTAKEDQEATHQARLKEIKDKAAAEDYARMDMALGAAENLFGSLADLTAKFAGKNSKAHKAMFALEKTVSIARAIMAINTGIALAAANPFPANLGAMATVAASTAGLVSEISSVGIAHGGLDNVPKEATYLLDKGERVLSPKQNKDLTQFIEKSGASAANVNIVVNNHSSEPVNVKRSDNGIEVVVGQIVDRLKDQVSRGVGLAETLQRTYSLQRRGS